MIVYSSLKTMREGRIKWDGEKETYGEDTQWLREEEMRTYEWTYYLQDIIQGIIYTFIGQGIAHNTRLSIRAVG